MNFSEKWGKDVDEAVKLALVDLKCNRDEVEVTVLEEPTKGFLGLGAKLAKVRVEKVEKKAEVKVEPKKEEKKPTEATEPSIKESNKRELEEKKVDNSRVRDFRKNKAPRKEIKNDKISNIRDGKINFERDDDTIEKPYIRNDRADRGDSLSISEKPKDVRPASDDNKAEKFLRDMIEKMGLEVNIKAFENDECIYIEMEGKDSRTVIGKRGQTLDAIQYLTNLVMNKDKEDYVRVIIDVEGYRFRREKTLEQLASKLARKVEKTGRNVRLEPMNPYERKVIHATLQSNKNVTTRSEGEEPYRRVIIEKK